VATAEAQAAGRRFEAAKFDLQKRVLTAWLDYALLAERVRIAETNLSLLNLVHESAASRVRAGGTQQDLLKADLRVRMAENELGPMRSKLPQMRTMLNAMLGRAVDAPLDPPANLPQPRTLDADDRQLLEVGVRDSPDLAALARQVAARRDALELARMQYIPDINPVAGLTGSVETFVGAMLTLPLAIPKIQGSIREARAMLDANEAMARQTRLDRAAQFVAVLYALRNGERQVALFQNQILPASERVFQNSRQAYATGSVGFVELIDSQRTLLDVRLLLAQARIAREKRLVELEALAGVDIETIRPAPATQPVAMNRSSHEH
jgi:outer membrane protein TolC